MNVTVQHVTRFEYSQDVFDGVMDVRLGPFSDQHQQWQSFALEASPYGSLTRYLDGFGNTAHLIALRRPHRLVEVTTRGTIQTLLADPFAAPRQPPPPLPLAERTEALLPSPLVPPLAALDLLAAPFAPAELAMSFPSAERLMHFVYDLLAYDQQATDVSTTVAEVLDHRRGVCQDFSHVMIGLCRAIGLPARYVSGYLVSGRGAGASHAWVEVFSATHGWRGFDPTNNLLAAERHVKMAIGRDYRDVMPNRGTFRGAASEHLSVAVEVHATEDAGAGV